MKNFTKLLGPAVKKIAPTARAIKPLSVRLLAPQIVRSFTKENNLNNDKIVSQISPNLKEKLNLHHTQGITAPKLRQEKERKEDADDNHTDILKTAAGLSVLAANILAEEERKSQINQYLKLAKSYEEKQDYINATAIYNFALALCISTEVIEEQQEKYQKIAKKIEEDLVVVEQKFLDQIKKEPRTTPLTNHEIDERIKQTKKYQHQLQRIRIETKEKIDNCSTTIAKEAPYKEIIKKEEEEENKDQPPRQSEVQKIYHNCNHELKNFVKEIIENSKQDLQDKVPYDCHYAIITLGSLGRNEATPYSDLEFGILIDDTDQETGKKYTEEEQAEIKEYFRNLTRLINIRVLNLGETTPFIQDIPEVNDLDFKPPIQNGFSFDSRRGIACKNPLGNGHVVERELAKLEKNNFLSEQAKDAQKEEIKEGHFELIGTPRELAKFHNQEWFLRDNHITTALFTTDILEANNAEEAQRIIAQYHQEKDQILDQDLDGITLRKQRSLLLLQEAAKQFEPSGGRMQEGGRTISPKYNFYRMPNLFIDRLSYMYNIEENDVWDRFNKLFIKSEDNPNPPLLIQMTEGKENIKWMLDRTMQIRLNHYMAKGTQDEDMMILDEASEQTKNELAIKLDDIIEVYYVMMQFLIMGNEFLAEQGGFPKGLFDILYFDNSSMAKARIYKLCEYLNKAEDILHEELEKLEEDNLYKSDILSSLAVIEVRRSTRKGFLSSLEYIKESLKIRKSLEQDDTNRYAYDLLLKVDNITHLCRAEENGMNEELYAKSLDDCNEAVDIFQSTNNNLALISLAYGCMADLHRSQGVKKIGEYILYSITALNLLKASVGTSNETYVLTHTKLVIAYENYNDFLESTEAEVAKRSCIDALRGHIPNKSRGDILEMRLKLIKELKRLLGNRDPGLLSHYADTAILAIKENNHKIVQHCTEELVKIYLIYPGYNVGDKHFLSELLCEQAFKFYSEAQNQIDKGNKSEAAELISHTRTYFKHAINLNPNSAIYLEYARFLYKEDSVNVVQALNKVIELKDDGNYFIYDSKEKERIPKELQIILEERITETNNPEAEIEVRPVHLAYFLLIKINLNHNKSQEVQKLKTEFRQQLEEDAKGKAREEQLIIGNKLYDIFTSPSQDQGAKSENNLPQSRENIPNPPNPSPSQTNQSQLHQETKDSQKNRF